MSRIKEFDYEEKLKAARSIFWRKGYHCTSLSDLVDGMDISRSSIYDTYGGKHDLFIKCLNLYIDEKDAQQRMAASRAKTPLEGIDKMIQAVLKDILSDSKTCLSVNSTFELGRKDKQVNELIRQQTLRSVELLKELISKAINAGALVTQKDPACLAHFLVSGITSAWNTHILFKDDTLTRQLIGQLTEEVLHRSI